MEVRSLPQQLTSLEKQIWKDEDKVRRAGLGEKLCVMFSGSKKRISSLVLFYILLVLGLIPTSHLFLNNKVMLHPAYSISTAVEGVVGSHYEEEEVLDYLTLRIKFQYW